MSATARYLGIQTEAAGPALKQIEPALNLELLESEHQKAIEQINEVDRRWGHVKKVQSYDIDVRPRRVKVSDSVWRNYLNTEIATQPVSRRARQHADRRRLLCKVYSRPGLPIGLRTVSGLSHSHDFLDSGVAFMAGGCQMGNDPVSATILTTDVFWAINTHASYWTTYDRPAPIMVPVGKTRELRRTFGDQVNYMVAWCPSLVTGVRLAMENDCRVAIRATPSIMKNNPASPLQDLIDSAVSWQQGLSRLIVQTHNLGALLESLPPIADEKFGMLSIRAKRRLSPYRRAIQA